MNITFKEMVEDSINLSIKNNKLIYQLKTENLEDVFVGVNYIEVIEIYEQIPQYVDEKSNEELFKQMVWKLLFEKVVNKYQQAMTQLMKKC